jgi:ferric-dicitrate binding protein FerR (iron transport regulator)
MPSKDSPFAVATSDVEARVIGTAFALTAKVVAGE